MQHLRRLYLLFLLLPLAAACLPGDETETPPPATASPEAIGMIHPQKDQVEHGRQTEPLQPIALETSLQANDKVGVRDGGEALLDFGDAMRLILFNDSELSVSTKAAPDTPHIVYFYLWWGGFVGEKVPATGSEVQVETPGDATITIAGTRFFVTYDRDSGQTTVGNFDGDVEVEAAGRTLTLAPGHFVEIAGGRPPGEPQSLSLSYDAFIERARARASAVAAAGDLEPTPTPTPTSTPTPTPTPTPAPPNPPARLMARQSCEPPGYAVALTWVDVAANEDGYRVERITPVQGMAYDTELLATLGPDAGRYVDEPGDPAQVSYRVTAFNEAGEATATVTKPDQTEECNPMPDLVVVDFRRSGSISTYNESGGADVPVRATVRNDGNAPAGIFKLAAHYRTDGATFVVAFIDPEQGNSYYPFTGAPLEPGDSVTIAGYLSFSSFAMGEEVEAWVVADSCSGEEFVEPYCRVEERDEGNNDSSAITFQLPPPPPG